MSKSSTSNVMRVRVIIVSLSILALFLALLNSVMTRSAIVLRDRARLDLKEPENAVLNHSFQQLMGRLVGDVLIAALASALSAIFGIILVAYPKWLREQSSIAAYYWAMQFILSLLILVTGAYLADHVYGFQSSFARLQEHDNLPYYSIMYYGGIGEAVYGALAILVGAGSFVMFLKSAN